MPRTKEKPNGHKEEISSKIEKINEINKFLNDYKTKHKNTVNSYMKNLMEYNEEVDRIMEEYVREFKIIRYKNTMSMNRFYLWAKREMKKCNDRVIIKSTTTNNDKIKENAHKIFNILSQLKD